MTSESRWTVHSYDTLPTTMDRAALLAKLGAPERTVVVSAEQTAGRGRGGRLWHSARGDGLYCTLILRPGLPADRLSTLPLMVGLAVSDAIRETTSHQPQLKWPNDVWLGDNPGRQKVAGILLSSAVRGHDGGHVLVGIGVNIAASHGGLPDGATTLFAATGIHITPDALLDSLLRNVDLCYEAFLSEKGRPSLEAWRAHAALLGESVSIVDGDRQLSGTFVGIADDGALLLEERPSHISRIVAGDLVRGPRRLG